MAYLDCWWHASLPAFESTVLHTPTSDVRRVPLASLPHKLVGPTSPRDALSGSSPRLPVPGLSIKMEKKCWSFMGKKYYCKKFIFYTCFTCVWLILHRRISLKLLYKQFVLLYIHLITIKHVDIGSQNWPMKSLSRRYCETCDSCLLLLEYPISWLQVCRNFLSTIFCAP